MRRISLIFIMSRIWQVLLLILVQKVFLPHHHPGPILSHFTMYDAHRYAQIAVHGYQSIWDTAFFPLYPLIIHALMWFGFPVDVAGLIVSNGCFLLAMVVLDKLMKNRGLREKQRVAVLVFLAFFPSAFYYTAMYSESCFLLISVLAFYQFEKGNIGRAYLIGGLAALARPQGIFVPFAFFVERLITGRLRWKDIFYGVLSAAISSGYPLYLYLTKGHPFLFAKVQHHFYRVKGYPFESVVIDFRRLLHPSGHANTVLILIHMVLLVMMLVYAVVFFVKHRTALRNAPYASLIFSLAVIVLPLCTMATQMADVATMGLIRFILEAFPFFIFWGSLDLWLYERQKLGIRYRLAGYLLFGFLMFATLFIYLEEAVGAYIA